MKKIWICLLALLLVFSTGTAMAESTTQEQRSAPQSYTATQKEKLIKELDLTASADTISDFENNHILCFDVSETGMVAFGIDCGAIVILGCEHRLQTVFRFDMDINLNYPLFHLNWVGENLELIAFKSYRTYLIDLDGNIMDVYLPDIEDEDVLDALHNVINRKEKTLNGSTYSMVKSTWIMKFFSGEKYDQLVYTDASGSEDILFDSASKRPEQSINDAIKIVVSFGIFLPCFIVFIITSTKRRIRGCIAYENARKEQPGSQENE